MRTNDPPPQPGAYDWDVERLSRDLKQQVERAKERISDRYGKLVESQAEAQGQAGQPGG